MNDSKEFLEVLHQICRQDPRFAVEAYCFVYDALAYTMNALNKNGDEASRHLSCVELANGIKDYAHEQFGPMAIDVFAEWGVATTGDLGHVVFNMIDHHVLRGREQDNVEQFTNLYDFTEAFLNDFHPHTPLPTLEPIIP